MRLVRFFPFCLSAALGICFVLLLSSSADAKVRRLRNQRYAQKSAQRHREAIALAASGAQTNEARSLTLDSASTESLTRELHRRIAELNPELARALGTVAIDSSAPPPEFRAEDPQTRASSASYDFAPSVEAPEDNIWASLSDDEAAGVIGFLHNQTALNLTKADDAGAWDNMISVVDLVPPNKTEAVAYLDANGTKPQRWAKATIMFGATDSPYVQDFAVGPLPVGENATYWSLDYVTTSGVNRIDNPTQDEELMSEFYNNVSVSIADITKDLLGNANTYEEPLKFYDIWGSDPALVEMKPSANGTMEPRIINWVTFWQIVEGFPYDMETLLPQGLYFKADVTGRDPSLWSVDGWLYNNIFYNSTDAFRQAWNSSSFEKIPARNEQGSWGGTDRVGESFKYDARVGPLTVYPGGKRYAVDADKKYVEWGAFSFYMGFSRDAGIQLYNIRYNGQRIVYHLGLQEAIAHYAGNDPVQSSVAYLDTYYGFGPYAFELLREYDCPAGATYLNTTFHASEESRTHRNSICLFEMDANLAMQRHASDAYSVATKNIQFVLRTVCTVGNYDYTFSYIFSHDGSIETKVSASGYIQSAFYAHNQDYGYQIHNALSGSMHDHVLTFKVDVDVAGPNNTFAKHGVYASNETYPWLNGTRSTFKMNRSLILSEDEGKLHWPYNGQTQYLILNMNQTNAYGENIGYRIMPGAGGGGHHLSMSQSDSLKNSMGFARDHIYVTKQKDNELWASHANNNLDTANPVIDFDKYLDGDSLDQQE
ncbi:hypothetical protein OC846_006302 [Tilletia horrida]|uniref:Amine oxidase n=1 Tax=Tilletia horrida TaxID=155126 RepID=A0AAN6GJQ6_9BASI|nr:hypothetical protein OC845_006340 [Tilletia horrida]KAK0543744.1 hypothetical protein OC846_006302 [Tilletia horrida]